MLGHRHKAHIGQLPADAKFTTAGSAERKIAQGPSDFGHHRIRLALRDGGLHILAHRIGQAQGQPAGNLLGLNAGGGGLELQTAQWVLGMVAPIRIEVDVCGPALQLRMAPLHARLLRIALHEHIGLKPIDVLFRLFPKAGPKQMAFSNAHLTFHFLASPTELGGQARDPGPTRQGVGLGRVGGLPSHVDGLGFPRLDLHLIQGTGPTPLKLFQQALWRCLVPQVRPLRRGQCHPSVELGHIQRIHLGLPSEDLAGRRALPFDGGLMRRPGGALFRLQRGVLKGPA